MGCKNRIRLGQDCGIPSYRYLAAIQNSKCSGLHSLSQRCEPSGRMPPEDRLLKLLTTRLPTTHH